MTRRLAIACLLAALAGAATPALADYPLEQPALLADPAPPDAPPPDPGTGDDDDPPPPPASPPATGGSQAENNSGMTCC